MVKSEECTYSVKMKQDGDIHGIHCDKVSFLPWIAVVFCNVMEKMEIQGRTHSLSVLSATSYKCIIISK
jgi:hypothetical protein